MIGDTDLTRCFACETEFESEFDDVSGYSITPCPNCDLIAAEDDSPDE